MKDIDAKTLHKVVGLNTRLDTIREIEQRCGEMKDLSDDNINYIRDINAGILTHIDIMTIIQRILTKNVNNNASSYIVRILCVKFHIDEPADICVLEYHLLRNLIMNIGNGYDGCLGFYEMMNAYMVGGALAYRLLYFMCTIAEHFPKNPHFLDEYIIRIFKENDSVKHGIKMILADHRFTNLDIVKKCILSTSENSDTSGIIHRLYVASFRKPDNEMMEWCISWYITRNKPMKIDDYDFDDLAKILLTEDTDFAMTVVKQLEKQAIDRPKFIRAMFRMSSYKYSAFKAVLQSFPTLHNARMGHQLLRCMPDDLNFLVWAIVNVKSSNIRKLIQSNDFYMFHYWCIKGNINLAKWVVQQYQVPLRRILNTFDFIYRECNDFALIKWVHSLCAFVPIETNSFVNVLKNRICNSKTRIKVVEWSCSRVDLQDEKIKFNMSIVSDEAYVYLVDMKMIDTWCPVLYDRYYASAYVDHICNTFTTTLPQEITSYISSFVV